jgi:general secretion pathway protein C
MIAVDKTRKILTVADIALLVFAAFLASQIVQGLILRPAEDTIATSPAGKVSSPFRRATDPVADAEAVIKRNLFDSRIGNGVPRIKTDREFSADLPESSLPLTLLGTVVNERGGRSFAIISQSGSKDQEIYFIGDIVTEGVILATVQRNRVVLLREGREEVLEKTSETAAPAPRRRPARRAVGSRVNSSQNNIRIRKVGDNNYVMDRREVEGVLADVNKLLTQIRIVPHFKDGKANGFKVFNIRPDSLFMKLGMINGDIIKRVNGLDITGPEQALQMYQQLKQESRITIDLERFSKNITLQYEVR